MPIPSLSTSAPLLRDTDYELDDRDDGYYKRERWAAAGANTRNSDRRAIFLLVFASLVSLMAIAINLLHRAPTPPEAPSPTLKLTYPNPYIGLELAVLPPDAPTPKPIVNYPLLLAQVNASEPGRAYVQTPHWDSTFGMVYPEDREVIVEDGVSTILQFRTLDFRMERCVLSLEIPSSAKADAEGLPHKRVTLSSDANAPLELHFHMLDPTSTESIIPNTLSWHSRPARLDTPNADAIFRLTASTPIEGALLHSASFACPERSVVGFEMSWSPDCAGCKLRFVQDHKAPRLGVYITQYSGTV
ncbi:hypothetical protein MKEN_00179900 [Mycena kentingensis (nom. inval.)]|nr:hypothetical protein MKEN_00179900 [Mycena kentingensis (nom. inval.)]